MEYITEFKKNINNPYNIKAFFKLFNKNNLKENLTDSDIKEFQSEILKERKKKRKTKIDDILNDIGITYKNPNINDKLKDLNNRVEITPVDTVIDTGTVSKISGFDFLETDIDDDNDYGDTTIELEMEGIDKERIKGRIRTVLREIKLVDDHYDVDIYYRITENNGISIDQLSHILSIVEGELSGYEGRTFVKDGIIMVTGFVEGYFDGTVNVLNRFPDLSGLQDAMEVSLRKRKVETANIHRTIRDKVGLGPWTQIGIDVFLNAGITIQRNAKGSTNETANAVRLKRNLDD